MYLNRIFDNLISNAVKFSPEGNSVQINVELNADRVRVNVVDQGEGIDEYREQVKESFAKLVVRKPESSRARSREVYYLASGKK